MSKNYCGDCLFFHFKKRKGEFTGETECNTLNQLRGYWQEVNCSRYVDKEIATKFYIENAEAK